MANRPLCEAAERDHENLGDTCARAVASLYERLPSHLWTQESTSLYSTLEDSPVSSLRSFSSGLTPRRLLAFVHARPNDIRERLERS